MLSPKTLLRVMADIKFYSFFPSLDSGTKFSLLGRCIKKHDESTVCKHPFPKDLTH